MSALSDFLSQPGFWWGVPLGAVVAGTIGPLITARSVRASDRRKAEQDERMDDRKAERENRQSNQKILRETATAFGEVCSAVIEKAIDPKGVFNAIRDAALTAGGMPDSKELEKLEFATDLLDESKKITTAYNNLRVVAPVAVLHKASALNAAMIALTQATTMPLARPPLMQKAGEAFEDFTNAVRAELDLEAFTAEDAERSATSYMDTLKKHVNDYIAESREQARRLGFIEPGSVGVPAGSLEVTEPGSIAVTSITADDLTDDHVGKFLGCHDPEFGFNYGAEIVEVRRDEESERPGVLLRIVHPPFPGARPGRVEQMRLRFTDKLELVDLPSE
ncbi:hypothetical protein HND25_15725 [Rhodococcus erythropolis]|uniref:hypothetical protein n=1 Tax=Rhodococcus erythropolis TaxID=1833 RepID=UPI000767D397|nr:hypothetical protein [Rhodococcus erythropolis]MBO8149198.1 hypothetical protein [Rhodococcus erythropolis]MDO1490062.1 hypothetical protein [Rhodococcus erythropolis]GCB56737.1 hypothetical protein rerp_31450 [Rhodococcus erythropolis]